MIDVEVAEGAIHAVDVEKNEVRIEVEGWESTETAPALDRRVDTAISGKVQSIVVPRSSVVIESAGADSWVILHEVGGSIQLQNEAHVVQFAANVEVFVAFTSGGMIQHPETDGPNRLEFFQQTPVTLGFRSQVTRPRHTITVPPSIEGVASAIRYLSSSIETDTPDKSYPSQRLHPPAIVFGDGTDIPIELYQESSFSDLTIAVPRSMSALFLTSPLTYYLQADIILEDAGPVEVRGPTISEPIQLGDRHPLENDVADLLHRVFYLDCLVRNAGPYEADLIELPILERLDLDVESLYQQSTADRLREYLDVDYGLIRSELPGWHLSTVVEPRYEHIRALPHLLDRLSLIQLPEPVSVNQQTLVSDSVSEAYDVGERKNGPHSAYDLIRNENRLARVQGWLAQGTPVDAFRATLESFENRLEYHDHSEGPRTVLVVMNDSEMVDELDPVERIYRKRADELAIEVTVEEELTRRQLADRLRSPVDFLHYIGHCDASGLRCPDGNISAKDIDETRVKTFFLNACGSYEQGMTLVKRGSVAGAVTLNNVLHPQATKVGTTFARLVMHGYYVEEALRLARRRVLMNEFYTVVGDGTYRLSQGQDMLPYTAEVDRLSEHQFKLRLQVPLSKHAGIISIPLLESEWKHHLVGNIYETNLNRDELIRFTRQGIFPVIFENRYFWSDELANRLSMHEGEHPAEI